MFIYYSRCDYAGQFTIQMGKISVEKVIAWWYDTRTGEAYKLGKYTNEGSVTFDPPGV